MSASAAEELVEFLLARIAEDEAEFGPEPWLDPVGMVEESHAAANNRVLVECEAKQRILKRVNDADDGQAHPRTLHLGDEILMDLAAVYAGHPDYRQEWRQ